MLVLEIILPSLTDYNISETLANYMTMVVDTKFSIQNIAMEEIKNNESNHNNKDNYNLYLNFIVYT